MIPVKPSNAPIIPISNDLVTLSAEHWQLCAMCGEGKQEVDLGNRMGLDLWPPLLTCKACAREHVRDLDRHGRWNQ